MHLFSSSKLQLWCIFLKEILSVCLGFVIAFRIPFESTDSKRGIHF